METNVHTDTNPWKGLNFYSEVDRNNFYGRDEEIQSLSLFIINNIQTILYGKSGIGKSSIINAGVFPAARQKGLLPISIRLSHEDDTSYIAQIRAAFEKAGIGITERVPRLKDHEESLWEFMHRQTFSDPVSGEPTRPLIVLDQFEEIFTLQHNEKKKLEFFAELADLLNGVTPQYIVDALNAKKAEGMKEHEAEKGKLVLNLGKSKDKKASSSYLTESRFNIVFVIREDFLSYMERYTKFIPVMKTNRYALLPLNEEQAADIIMKPKPGLVSREVAKLIIQKVTNRTDFDLEGTPEIEVDAAVLSLFLSGLYRKKEEQGLETITAELVNQAGQYIISDFYVGSIAGMPEKEVETLEDELLTSDGRRNNVSRSDLIRDGISEEAIKDLVENHKLLRQFSYQDDIRIEYMHDILCPVISERIEQREIARRQEEEQRRLLAEEQRKREAIEAQAKAERERMENEAKQMKQRVRRRFAVLTAILLFVALWGGLWFFLFEKTYSTYYANFTTENGWPVGLGEPVNPHTGEAQDLLQLYKLTKKGIYTYNGDFRRSPYSKVEIVSPNGQPVMNMLYETPVVGLLETELDDPYSQEFAKLQQHTSRWEYIPNLNWEVSQCIAYGDNDSVLYAIQYYHDNSLVSADSKKYTQWAVFNDAAGKSMIISQKGTDRMRQTVDSGYVTSCMFFTALGVPQQNAYGSYGYAYELDSASHMVNVRYDVNEFGDRIEDTAFRFENDPKTGREIGTKAFRVLYSKGMRIVQFQNFSDTITYRPNGAIDHGTFHTPNGEYSLIKFGYDELGRRLTSRKYSNDSLVEFVECLYNEKTGRLDRIAYLENGVRFEEIYSYPDSMTTEISLMRNNKKCEVKRIVNEYRDAITYHKYRRKEICDSLLTITEEYMDTSGNLVDETKGEFAKRKIQKDTLTKNTLLDYYYLANGDIYKSTWYEYDEYGRQIAQAVAGIDGTPVRSPNWAWDRMCYYKVSLIIRDGMDKTNIATTGYDEFGNEAYVIQGSNVFSNKPMSIEAIQQTYELEDQGKILDFGIRLAQTRKTPLNNSEMIFVPFLQLLQQGGTMYSAKPSSGNMPEEKRPLDGDVLYRVGAWHIYGSEALLQSEWNKLKKNGGQIEVLRAEGQGIKKGTKAYYKRHTFVVAAGNLGATYHMMPIQESQQNRIKNAQL